MKRFEARMVALAALALLPGGSLAGGTLHDYKDRVGVYVWGKLGGGLDAVTADIKRLGADHVVRVYIGPGTLWDPAGKADNSPLDVKVRRADYRAFLSAFPVVMLTSYDSASWDHYKKERLDAAHLAATKEEFRRFALELAKAPGRKIVSNWEFENDCTAPQWPACREYYQARLDGIAEGKKQAKALAYPGEVFSAFEFLVVPGFKGKLSGLADFAPQLKGVDFLSYSSWWSIAWDADSRKVYKDFAYLAGFLRGAAVERKLPTQLIIGEFGEYWNVHPDGTRLKALVDASIDNGVEYLFNWVLYDQPGNKDEWGRDASHFGKYRLDRILTPQGEAFRHWFQPQ